MNCHPFDQLMELETEQIRLDCACLHMARDFSGQVNVNTYLRTLDTMAQDVADRAPARSTTARFAALREVLMNEYELRGNEHEYYDPQNIYLNRVLDRRVGIPISLAVIWIEVGRRLHWPVRGIGFPGHFLVRIEGAGRPTLVDPFFGGPPLSTEDCRQLLDYRFHGELEFSPAFLKPVDTRSILKRMLENLRSIYLVNSDWPRLAPTLRRLAAVEPGDGRYWRELAAVHCRLGDVRSAYAHLAAYAQRSPDAEDSTEVRRNLRRLEAAVRALN